MGEAGHKFLAKLGKKRLRPGGKRATDWLIEQGGFSKDTLVLEVACNMGTTAIELAQRFGCKIVAVDMDSKALELAKENAKKAGVAELVTFERANAMKLPYKEQHFDIVLNEAMLTMQAEAAKKKCVQEYLRVLKPGGIVLTHDVLLKQEKETVRQELSSAINVNVGPLTESGWRCLMQEAGYASVATYTGDMTLMKLSGMVYDEGWLGTLKICLNACKKENRKQFWTMYKMFQKNKEELGFIAMASRKSEN
ncbi:class I SAM-dependent methyltransferase [Streptococcus oralis]|uniref:SAM-dependent methyltransferase HI0095 (UbiE-like) n=1 Tax=Streptococcus oralis TaxID=1303 RepID=A0A139PD72_STROR|nr:class I SAM-dependent methyltransferase [Streptococcus oralis]KXT85846.1 SAM-dependent methyltransferase HI0095 (UbiE-like) [Streptococcus oralis]